MGRTAPNQVGLAIRELDLAEARARAEAAFDMLDRTWDPPVNEDVRPMRALIEARLRLLPGGFELADDYVEITPEERVAGRRQGVPAAPLSEAVASVEDFAGEMLEVVNNPDAWGPAKTFAVAALGAGVNLTDPGQVNRFIRKYNDGLAA